ncbi:unnamed protein product [Calicophoron daubneyi]|uniref:CCHC-type domain-containing protein n=1 Tax=Calicophoron daubneyi TaxID=300641 RepID=A0AAV2TBW5_CALDB
MESAHPSDNTGSNFRVGCKKCGFTGHLTFQCRNYLRGDITGDVVLDVSSTSSQSDDDELIETALQLKRAELEAKKAEKLKEKEKHKSHHHHKRKKKHSRSSSLRSDSDPDLHLTKKEHKLKKHRKHHKKKENQ